MTTSEKVREVLEGLNPNALTCDGLDDALVGVLLRPGKPAVAVYDTNRVIDVLEEDMGYDDAVEYYQFNIIGAYVGPSTPVFADIRWDASEEAPAELTDQAQRDGMYDTPATGENAQGAD